MLTHVEVVAAVDTYESTHFFWDAKIEFSLDCFICRRRRRTVILEQADEEGRCVSARKPSELVPRGVHNYDEVSFTHPAPIQITAFDTGTRRLDHGNRQTLRCRLSYWWAPFHDVKKPQDKASPLTRNPWVRLTFGLGCLSCHRQGRADALRVPGKRSIQSNMVWPWTMSCPSCGDALLTTDASPVITLLDQTIP